jgi:Zn-dependent peptidase ImmA (M78 family)
MLRWAREAAGLDLAGAAKRLAVKLDRLEQWEDGSLRPTFNQLRTLGRVYRRPTAFFYLTEPPPEPETVKDFRHMPALDDIGDAADLQYAIRRARDRRTTALELLADLGEEPPAFPLSASRNESPTEIASRIRNELAVEIDEQRSWPDAHTALREWTRSIESIGALVFQVSDVDVAVFRGFSLSEMPLPIVAINGKDSPHGRVFTMMHELAHLALRMGGLCDLHENADIDGRLETFCNQIAAEALVPDGDLSGLQIVSGHRSVSWSDEDLNLLSRRYSVSREVVLRRLLTLGRTSQAFYQRKRAEYLEQGSRSQPSGGFLEYYRRVLRDNGPAYTNLVLSAYRSELITARDASHYLGDIKVTHFPKITSALRTAG